MTPSRHSPPPLPNTNRGEGYDIRVPDLEQFSRERAEQELILDSRQQERAVLSGGTELEVLEAGPHIELGGSDIELFLETPGDTLSSLQEIEENLHENGVQNEDTDELKLLFEDIEARYPVNDAIIDKIRELRTFVRRNVRGMEPLSRPARTERPKKAPRKKPEVSLFDTKFEVPLGDTDGAKEVLERVKELAERSDTSNKEETELLRFLQEVEQTYPETTELNDLIIGISRIVGEKKGYIAVEPPSAVPEVEYRQPSTAAKSASRAGASSSATAHAEPSASAAASATAGATGGSGSVPPPPSGSAESAEKTTEGAEERLEQAMQSDQFLATVFLDSNHVTQMEVLRESGYDIPNKGRLRKLVAEFLEQNGDRHQSAVDGGYKAKDSLTLRGLVLHGVEPDNVDDFSTQLQEFLPKKKGVEASATADKPVSVPEDIDTVVDRLFEAIKDRAEFKELVRAMRLLKADPATVRGREKKGYSRAMLYFFGTNDIRPILGRIRDGEDAFLREYVDPDHYTTRQEIDQKTVLRRAIENLEGEITPDIALGAAMDVLGRLKALKPKSGSPSTTTEPSASDATPAPADSDSPPSSPGPTTSSDSASDTAPAPAPDTTPSPAPDVVSERTPMPASLTEAIEQAAEGNEQNREKLLDLWEVVNSKAKLDNEAQTSDVRTIMERAVRLSGDDRTMPIAVYSLGRLLELTESTNVLPLSAEEVSSDRLTRLLNALTENLPELRGRLNDIFAILGIRPTDYPESADYLESIRRDMRVLLLTEIPKEMGIGECADIPALLEALRTVGARGLRSGMRKIAEMLSKDRELEEIIADFYRITGRESGSTPPPVAPSAALGPSVPTSAPDMGEAPDTEAPANAPTAQPSRPKGREFGSETARIRAINGFLTRMGYSADSAEPAIVAIRQVLGIRVETMDDLEALERFLMTATFEDEIDIKFRGQTLEDLRSEKKEMARQLQILEANIEATRAQLRKPTADTGTLRADFARYAEEKHNILSEMGDLDKAIERKAQRKGKETIHYRNPAQLLGMINMHFAQTAAGVGVTPDYEKVLIETQEQLEEARKEEPDRWNWVCNRLLPWNYLKPRLASTLQAIVTKDPVLKRVTPESAAELAKAWDNPQGVIAWIRRLEGSEKENMEKVVPALIAHLSVVVNTGRVANINSLSLNRARELLMNLRQAVHKYSMEHAEAHTGSSLDRLNAYFTEMNTINKRAVADENIVTRHSRRQMFRNLGIAAGTTAAAGTLGVGALAMAAGLSAPVLAGASVAGMAVPFTYGSLRAKNPKMKAFLNNTSVRCLATGAIGGLAMAATPYLLPITAAGLFAPEIWKHRKQIAPPVARVAGKTAYVGARVGLAGFGIVAGGGVLPLFSSTWRKLFGIHLGPYLGN